MEPKNRCLVPANSFAEYAPEPNPDTKKKDVVWFALNDDRPPFEEQYSLSEDGQRLIEVVGFRGGRSNGFTMSRVWDRSGQ